MQDFDHPDPFTIPGTDTLRNHLNLSGDDLERVERLHTQIRQEQPLPDPAISVLGFRRQAGHSLKLDRIERDAWMHASRESSTQRYQPMTNVIRGAMPDQVRGPRRTPRTRGSS